MIAVVSRPLCRNSFNTSSPFLTGISISRITSSGASLSNLSRHSRPLAAVITREPRLFRVSLRMSRMSASSSATRMLPLRVFIDSVSPGFLLHPRPILNGQERLENLTAEAPRAQSKSFHQKILRSLHCNSRNCSQAAMKFSYCQADKFVRVGLPGRQERCQDAVALFGYLPAVRVGNFGNQPMSVQQC